ncbi:hypothetical protein HELRODRAFT_189753 [Helobdella robusta]|uniref:Uncharacterized protein n=1 Tax=Helobdella robusta TaxID=6412 RepID=T1FRC2_HELRO|nr:hypothetical protein HELRODRAFT_189753 [Helobdella robusta]ESN91645.1 hypothetical protein HELRODRAFT_189753 [Helobdella robusta]
MKKKIKKFITDVRSSYHRATKSLNQSFNRKHEGEPNELAVQSSKSSSLPGLSSKLSSPSPRHQDVKTELRSFKSYQFLNELSDLIDSFPGEQQAIDENELDATAEKSCRSNICSHELVLFNLHGVDNGLILNDLNKMKIWNVLFVSCLGSFASGRETRFSIKHELGG